MKKYFLLIIAIISMFILLSCKGETGPAGAIGEDGKPLYVQMFQYQVYPDSSYQNTNDNTIIDTNNNYNYGSCSELGIMNNFMVTKGRSLLKFNNLENFIPANVTIKDAYLVLYGGNFITSTISSISAYKLTRDWTEGTVCGASGSSSWLNYSDSSTWTNPGGDFETTPVSDAVKVNTYAAYYTLKLNTQMVKDWITSPATNYGVLIKNTDETKVSYMEFGSKENVTYSFRPKLVIYYTIP